MVKGHEGNGAVECCKAGVETCYGDGEGAATVDGEVGGEFPVSCSVSSLRRKEGKGRGEYRRALR